MPDRYIEKSFLFLLVLSLLLHLGVFALLYYLPQEKQPLPKEPVFVDLQQIPELKSRQPTQQEAKRLSDQRMRVERETAPRGEDMRDSAAPVLPRPPASRQSQARQREAAPRESPTAGRPTKQLPPERREAQVAPGSSIASLLKSKQQAAPQKEQPKLFPGSNRIAKLEDEYRRKYESNIAEGDSRLLNIDDTRLISFFRRLENAVYGVWRVPHEAEGLTGDVIVLATFNARTGEIIRIKSVENSGFRILDDEVYRVLRAIGPIGPLPNEYLKPEYDLFIIFSYGKTYKRVIR